MSTAARLVAATLLLGAFLSACGADGPRELGPSSTTPPPDGTTTVSCDLTTDDGELTFSFALGDDYAPDTLEDGEGCLWSRPAPRRGRVPTTESIVVVRWVGDTDSLQDVYARQEPYVGAAGDDEVSDLRLAEDVPVFGETIGDRVRWDCFCDGLPNITYESQAAGVRLYWNASSQLQDQIEDEVRTALASAGTG